MIIELLKLQLEKAEASNAALTAQIELLTQTIKSQSATIKGLEDSNASLNITIQSLEKALLDKGESIEAIERKLRGLSKLLNKENEKAKPKRAAKPSGQSSKAEGSEAASDTPVKKE